MTRTRMIAGVVAWGLAAAAPAVAQTPDFSGTWTLDLDASRITAPPLGGGDGGPADTLHITQAANGTLVVGNEVNAAQAWTYEPDGESAIPVGRNDTMTVTSTWEGSRFVSEGRRDAGPGNAIIGVREVRSLSDAGRTLTVEVTTTTPDGDQTNTLVYTRVD